MQQHPEPARRQPGGGTLGHQQVLEHPAGQRHLGQPVPLPRQYAPLLDQRGDPVVEPGRDDRRRHPLRQLTGDRLHQAGALDTKRRPIADRRPVAPGLTGVGQLLEFHGGLALVVDRVPD